jgi:hypothetical protein
VANEPTDAAYIMRQGYRDTGIQAYRASGPANYTDTHIAAGVRSVIVGGKGQSIRQSSQKQALLNLAPLRRMSSSGM